MSNPIKKFLSAFLILILVLFTCFPIFSSAAGNLPFKDIENNIWYSYALNYMYSNKYVSGTTATTFSPYMTLDRAMLVTILHNMEGRPKVNGTSKFSDVKDKNIWFYNAVVWASSVGVVSGNPNGTFAPYRNITREEVAAMLVNYSRYKKDIIRNGTSSNIYFADTYKVSSWATDAVKWATSNRIINGKTDKYNNTLIDPQGTATRAEAITMIKNYIDVPALYNKPIVKATYGQTLANVKLPEGFNFEDPLSTSVGLVGQNTFRVTYTPKNHLKSKVRGAECVINVGPATYGIDEVWSVPDQWDFKINSVTVHEACNEFSDLSGQVVTINYTYTNTGYKNQGIQNLYINGNTDFTVYDETNTVGHSYPCTHNTNPQPISEGKSCTATQSFVLDNESSTITINVEKYTHFSESIGDSIDSNQSANFVVTVNK